MKSPRLRDGSLNGDPDLLDRLLGKEAGWRQRSQAGNLRQKDSGMWAGMLERQVLKQAGS